MYKTAIVTGGAKGIGAGIATLLSENGFNVVITYLNSEKQALDLKNSLSGKSGFEIYKCDVRDKAQTDDLVKFTLNAFGSVDLLVNNAGIANFCPFTDITPDLWSNMITSNLTSVYNCSHSVISHMINNKYGRIVNISSIWGITGGSCEVDYSASKAGIIGFTKALAKEMGPSGITVNCIAPGVIKSDMNSNLSKEDLDAIKDETPLGSIGSPFDVAALVLLLAQQSGDFITGQVISPNGGFVI